MEYENIIYAREGGVTTITINRPRYRNSLDMNTARELHQAFRDANEDAQTRCVVITGAGSAFASGGDLKFLLQAASLNPVEVKETIYSNFQGIARGLLDMEKPTIAAVNGPAVGAGFDMCLACDIRIASDKALFSEAFARLGAIPGMCGMYMLPHIIGLGRALELAYTAEAISGQEAERIGLANKVVPHDELIPYTKKYAERLANGPTKALAMIKVGMRRALAAGLQSELEFAAYAQGACFKTEDFQEGIRAAVEKRPPVFKGK
jgi:2-(1,2-epoxy-1,2-dihydrophenyl)acetyl-CoA isomerase